MTLQKQFFKLDLFPILTGVKTSESEKDQFLMNLILCSMEQTLANSR
jgi:hypothetical protein